MKGEFLMGLRFALAGIAVAVCTVTTSASQNPADRPEEQVLVELERDWNEAFYEKDVTVIERLLADEFIATYDDGNRGDKARELALAANFNQRVESAVQDEFTVKLYGETAVVWFTLRVVGFKEGLRTGVTLRFTDVWVKRDGRWQCVSSQGTSVAPEIIPPPR
jgi:ketosteroid isomerase-like protein